MARLAAVLLVSALTIASSACLSLGGKHEATPPPAGGRPFVTATPRPSTTPPPTAPPAAARLEAPSVGAEPTRPGTYVLDIESARVTRVSDLPGGLWSPDGGFIAFSRCCDPTLPGYIEIVDLGSGTSVRVSSGNVRDLAWSPDSIHLAYVAMDRNLAAIGVYVVDRDGYNPHAVVKDAGAGEPRWLDDRRIAYSKGNPGDVPTFFVTDTGKPGAATRLNPRDPPDAQDPRIVFGFPSSDGLWVVYYEGTYHSDLGQTLAWNSQTGELRVLLPKLALGEFAPGTHRVRLFLPDPATNGTSFNQVFDLDSGASFPPLRGLEAHWSADGARLVYETAICENDGLAAAPALLSALPDGSAVRRLTFDPGEHEYGYAVSGATSLVAFTAVVTGASPAYRLGVASAEGDSRLDVPLALDPHLTRRAWSPDGRHVLFSLGTGQAACG